MAGKMLKGRTALVTGATQGIGEAIAQALAAAGADVVVHGIEPLAGGEAAASALAEAHGVRAAYVRADLADPAQAAALVSRAAQALAAPDILVNNAGIQHTCPIESFPPERWDAIIAINLSSAFHTTRLALPAMRRKNWGRVINIASAHGLVASAQKSAYVAAKHGIVGLTKTIALETATSGITVNAICPGWVLTPLVQKQIDDRAKREGIAVAQASNELLREKQPSLQFTTPEQLGELALFLCSPAADNVRGVAWAVDGGWTAQ